MNANGLTKLIEECGELIQIAAKKIAFMHTDEHPDGAGSMDKRLVDEMADVAAAINFVIEKLGLDTQRFYEKAESKVATYEAWDAKEE